jgi:hypothetical protein
MEQIINEENFQRKIYRYEFSREMMDLLHNFSKIHQYDDRDKFKEAWNIWILNNSDIIDYESEKMKNDGYNCIDVNKKMYISARYYFRKKIISDNNTSHVQKRKYITVQKSLINCMDEHILCNINKSDVFKPSNGFVDFCITNKNILKEEISSLLHQEINDLKYIQDKIKKTYKNRCFTINSRSQLKRPIYTTEQLI